MKRWTLKNSRNHIQLLLVEQHSKREGIDSKGMLHCQLILKQHQRDRNNKIMNNNNNKKQLKGKWSVASVANGQMFQLTNTGCNASPSSNSHKLSTSMLKNGSQ